MTAQPDALDDLMTEHRAIERGLDLLDRYAGRVGQGDVVALEPLRRLVEFIRVFADDFHHAKEEDVLFATMVNHGFPRGHGPVAVMLQEHQTGRALVREMSTVAKGDAWTDEGRATLVRAATEFTALLRAHIQKEDSVLYPLARQRLPPPVLAQIDAACARVRRPSVDASALDELERLVEA